MLNAEVCIYFGVHLQEENWNTTDEETESGESDTEKSTTGDSVKPKPSKSSTSATNSPARYASF